MLLQINESDLVGMQTKDVRIMKKCLSEVLGSNCSCFMTCLAGIQIAKTALRAAFSHKIESRDILFAILGRPVGFGCQGSIW